MRPPQRIRGPVLGALVAATAWFGAVLLAWETNGWPNRFLAVPLSLLPFVVILLWTRGRPR